MVSAGVFYVLAANVCVVASNTFLALEMANQFVDQKTHDSQSTASFLQISEGKKEQADAAKELKRKAKAGGETKSKSDLPEFSKVMNKSNEVFETLNSKVSTLTAQLAKMQTEGANIIMADKKEYESKLMIQQNSIDALKLANINLSEQIYSLVGSNQKLRSKAEALQRSCASVTADLQQLRVNITTAQEFADDALADSDELLTNSDQVTILGELAEQDAVIQKIQTHERRLMEIRNAKKLSMLQAIDSSIADGNSGQAVTLVSALERFTQEQNASRAALKASFDAEFRTGEQRREELLEEQTELNIKRDKALIVQGRLSAAVKHLEETHEILYAKSLALRSFAGHLSAREMPVSN